MGLFVHEDPAASPPRSTGKSARGPLLSDTQRGCEHCTLQASWPKLKTPRMKVSGSPDADVLVLGEAPGEEEDRVGEAFVGPAGRLLRGIVPSRQMKRLALTNIVRCRPANNRNPSVAEIHACSVHLEETIANGHFKAILGLGSVPLQHFLPGIGITSIHGLKFPVEIAGKLLWYYPTLHPAFILHGNRSGGDSPAQPILENDIKRFFRELDNWPRPAIICPQPDDVICCYNVDEARRHCDELRRHGKLIGFDIETTGLRPNAHSAHILTAAVSDGETIVAWPIHHSGCANNWGLPLALEMTQWLPWVAHNAAFELAWLRHHHNSAEWEPQRGFDDSMALARLYQKRETCLNLGILTRLYCGINIKTLSDIDTTKIANTPLADVLPYNGLDSWGSWFLYRQLVPLVDRDNYQSILDTITSTVDMQLAGLDVDQQAVLELRRHWQERADSAATTANNRREVRRYVEVRQRDFNIGSNDQVGDALVSFGGISLPKNANGTYKTDDATLTANAPNHPLALAAVEYRHAKKMDSTYIEPCLQAPSKYTDRRLHPVYSTCLVRTLRLSSEDPNIQNFPKRVDHEVRRMVVPPKDCLWVAADYGQLEARVYACATRDPNLCASIIAKEDIHGYWLDHILRVYPPYVDRLHAKVGDNRKVWRDMIKGDLVFASLYGSTPQNVSDRTGIPLEIATDILGVFWDRYRVAAEWLKQQRRQYRDTGTVRNLCGVERYGLAEGNLAINYPVQSTAARLVLDAQNELAALAREHNDPFLLPRINIHDDLCFAMPANDLDRVEMYVDGISEVLTRVRYSWMVVPLTVEWRVGANWADLSAFHEYTGDYVRS